MGLKRKIRRHKKYFISIPVIVIVIIIYFLMSSELTFEKGFNRLLSYDDKYNASFKLERLNRTMVDLDLIDPFIQELEIFKEKLSKYEDNKDIQALTLLTDARINMLKSEKHFHLARNIGDIGIASGGFKCSEEPYLINSAYYYNNSYIHGIKAYSQLDDLLNIYRDVPNLRKLVGINETKVKFYSSPIFGAQGIATLNIDALSEFCGYDKTKPLKPVVIR